MFESFSASQNIMTTRRKSKNWRQPLSRVSVGPYNLRTYVSNRYEIMHLLRYGKERRSKILEYLGTEEAQTYGGLAVNRTHCPNLAWDPDLRFLLKKGLVKRERSGSRHSKTTRLVLS